MPAATPPSAVAPAVVATGRRLGPEALPPALRPFVREVSEKAIPAAATPVRLTVCATTVPNLCVTLAGGVRVATPGGESVAVPALSLSGPTARPFVVDAAQAVRWIDVRFAPVGPFALLGVTAYAPGAPLESVVRPALAADARAWACALRLPPGVPPDAAFEARARQIVGFLADQLPAVPDEAAFLMRVVDTIEATEGMLDVAALARALGVSTPTLRRRFAVLGLGVKAFSSVVRFRHARAFVAHTPGATWAQAAHRFHYADQPHLVREVRRFTGAPPTRWADGVRFLDRDLATDIP